MATPVAPNPSEMAFAKLKALIRRAAPWANDDLWQAVGHVFEPFTEQDGFNVSAVTASLAFGLRSQTWGWV